MSQEMNMNEKPTIGKNENVENPLTKTTTPESTGDKPAEIIYREIRIVEPSKEIVQDLKNKKDMDAGKPFTGLGHDKPFTGLGHDKVKDKDVEPDRPHDIRTDEQLGDKYGAGKPLHDLGHDDSGPKVKMGPASLSDKLHGERLKDKNYSDAPKHDKDAYVGGEQRYVGSDKHLAYPAEEPLPAPRPVGVGEKNVILDKHHPTPVDDDHTGDKYHNEKGSDLGQNLGQGYDDGTGHTKLTEPLSPRDKHADGEKKKKKHLFGKKHDDDRDKHHDKHKLTDDGDHKKHHLLGGKKHDHDKKLTGKDEPLVGDKHTKHHKHPKTHDHTVVDKPVVDKPTDGEVVTPGGEKVIVQHQLKEADHIGDKYISKKGWDLGQNLGKKYEDADTYKLTDGHRYVPSKGDRVDNVDAVPTAPPVAPPPPALPSDERITVPSAHGEKVYGHELKDRPIADRPIADRPIGDREGDIIGDERQDKHLKDKDYATEATDESHKKPGVIAKAIEKVKEKLTGKSSEKDTTPDPYADKGHHWEKVADKQTGEPHWKDRGVEKGDKNKSKETY
jgi:hypothetical protein